MINSVSFGKKIPVMQCKIQNRINKEPVNATISEYDCTNYTDISDIFSQCGKWNYGRAMASDMNLKLFNYLNYDTENYPYKFYVMEDEGENIIGICETENSRNNVNIFFLESEPKKKYKYIGQTMLAAVGKMLSSKNGHNMYVMNPAAAAITFYTQKCNFEPLVKNREWDGLIMQSEKISGFIKDVEEKSGGKIINIKG